MEIKYRLQKLSITSDSDDHSGRVELNGTLDESEIVDEMIARRTSLSKQDILGVLDLFYEVVSDEVQSGFAVTTRLANFRPGIKGVFRSVLDAFDPERHYFHASITQGTMLKKKMREAIGERLLAATAPVPVIVDFFDHASSRRNDRLTPGNIGEIRGEDLKFDSNNSSEGIFFINESDAAEKRVETVSVATDGRLIFLIPGDLEAGKYTMEVRRAYTSNSDIRTGELFKTVTALAS